MITDAERTWLREEYLPSCFRDEDAIERRAMLLVLKMADDVALDRDTDGAIEWIVFTFDGEDYPWNEDDGWDGCPGYAPALLRLQSALKGAVEVFGVGEVPPAASRGRR